MPGNGAAYAAKKRKKPVQKMAKPLPEKTNPSKRHRDRLNVELDRLTSLLPFSEEVRGRLDKLSVLRLSVGYLKAKSYCHVALQKRSLPPPVPPNGRNGESVSLDGVSFSEGDLLLQALNGFVLVVTTDGMVFYTSPTIQDFLGFHQSDVVHQSVYDLIHMDDREMFRCQLHFALNPGENHSDGRAEGGQSGGKAQSGSLSLLPQHIPPENSSFLERSFCCRLRCLLDNNSGFLALNFGGRLKYLHLQGNTLAPQLALFAIATPVQPPSVMEIRTKTLIFQSKHRMDFAPLGIDTRGKLVLGYTEIELVTTGSGYQFIHAADMMYCADNHLRMIKTGDSGFTFFRLLMKTGQWLWVQANARIVFKGGRPDFIIARQKALTNEEGEEHLHQRRQQLPFNLATGEGVLYDTLLDDFSMPGPPGPPGPPGSGAPVTAEPTTEKPLDPASLLGSLRRQDHSIYTQPQTPSPQLPDFPELDDLDLEQPESSYERAFLDSHALLSVPGQVQVSPQRSVTGDFTSDAMMDSLEQILGDIGEGSVEGLEVKETELKEWENALVRMNNEREDASRELDRILANDVFSYVEEALRRETGGFVPGPDQTHVSGNGLSLQRQHAGSVFSNSEQNPGFAQQTLSGLVLGGGGCPTGLRGAPQVVSHTLTPTPCRNTHQAHPSPPWPRMISTQSCHDTTQQSWFPSVHDTNNAGGHRPAPELTDQSARYTLNHVGSQHAYMSPQLQSPSVWPPQQLHTLTHSSHTPGGVNSTAPQTQRSSGSCMYEKREGHMPNAATVPARRSGPLPGLAGPASAPFALSHPGADVGQHGNSNTVGLVHMSGGDGGPLASRSDYPPGNGSLESSFFCWSGEAQIPRGPLNGVVDPFAFPARPTGSVNLSQNTGS